MRTLLRYFFLSCLTCFSWQLGSQELSLDSIQDLVDNENPELSFPGRIGLAEYYFLEDPERSQIILEEVNLEEAGLSDSTYRKLLSRKVELIKRLYDHKNGLVALNKALVYSKGRNDSVGIAKWHELKASHFYYLFQYDSCRASLKKAISLLNQLDLQENKGNLILKSAGVEYAIGNYEEAIKSAFEAAEIFKRSNQEKQLGVAYLQLGNIHYFLKKYEEAQTYYDLSAVHFKRTGDQFGYQNAISNLGLIHIEKGEYSKGIQLQHMALKHFRKEKRYLEEGNSYYYLGKAYNGLKNYDSSDFYLNKSIKSNLRSDYQIGVAYAYWIKSKNQIGRDHLESALKFNDLGLQITDSVKNYEIEKLLQEQRSALLEKKGKYKSAFKALKRSIYLEDSLDIDYQMLNELATEQRAELETAEFELKLARQEGEQQKKENERQKQLIVAISIIAFLLILFVGGLILTNRKNKFLHQQLMKNQDEMAHELDTKKALLKEIHHRVKNNLQIINSMLSIQAQYVNDARLDEVVSECRSRIVSMSLIHESLYRKEDDERSLFSNYIRNLLPQLIDTYHVDKSKVELDMEIEDFELSLDDSVPCGLMINEIISNSLKHAFPDGKNGKISLRMFKEKEEMVLQIADNGIGLQKQIDPEAQDTFGFLLIYTLAHQLEARVTIAREEGLSFDIRWKTKSDKLLS